MSLANSSESIDLLVRPNIQRLKAYESARSLNQKGRVFLDANEAAVEARDGFGVWARYPDPQPSGLIDKIANLYGVSSQNLLVGRGSDEAIDLLIRSFCEPRESAILITPPTYGMYAVSAAIQDVAVEECSLMKDAGSWFLPVSEMTERVGRREKPVRIIFVCSPNNPTGTVFDLKILKELCARVAGRALVVVDEAYIEFSQSPSATTMLDEFPNLAVLRTFSKAWAMAGIRCGTVIGHPRLIEILRKVRAPYPLPEPVSKAVMAALGQSGRAALRERVTAIVAERDRVQKQLCSLSNVEAVCPSEGNFLLVQFRDNRRVWDEMQSRGIILRDRSKDPLLPRCIRITIGTKAQNDEVIKVLEGLQ